MKLKSPWLEWLRRRWLPLVLAGILLLAVFMRFWQLDTLPPGLHPDEAANGLDVFRIFNGDLRPLYNTNGPRESLFFFIQAIFVKLLGHNILALRLAPALIGTLAVITTYLWAKSWFGQRVGLIAAFLMAVTPWAVTMSRLGFRASMTPLFVTLTLWLYTKGFQTGRLKWFAWAGLSLGAGMYTYLAFRLFPLALVLIAIAAAIWHRPLKHWVQPVIASLIVASLALVPLGIWAVQHPEDVLGGRNSTSFMNPELNHGRPLMTLVDTTVKTVLMFNIHGDENYRHNLGGQPLLNAFVGIMFILGLLISVTHIRRLVFAGLLATFGVMLLPELLTAEGIPHALRAVGALPATLVLAALGIHYMLQRWYATFPINSAARGTGLMAVLILLFLTAYQGYAQYFVAWAQSPQTYKAHSEDAVRIADYINRQPYSGQRYLVMEGYSNITVTYLTGDQNKYQRLELDQIDGLPLDSAPKQFIISPSWRERAVAKLRTKFPQGKLTAQYSTFNDAQIFFIYEVKP